MSTRQVWGEFTLDSEPTANSTNPVESGGVFSALEDVNAAINKGINARPSVRYVYSLLGTISVSNVNKTGFMALDVYCCEKIEAPVKIEALIFYREGVGGSYKCTSPDPYAVTRFKLSWKMASDSSADLPKFEVWLIDTIGPGSNRRRIGCETHLVDEITWTDGANTTTTLPAGLTDFTLSYNSSN